MPKIDLKQKKEYEPHCGESVCRLFNLNEVITNQNIENDEQFILNAYAEVNHNLATIIGKSKQRHIELANEVERAKRRDRERGSRSRSSSKGKELDKYDRHSSGSHDEKSKSREMTSVNGHLSNETYSYNNTNNNYRYRRDGNDYRYSQNQSSSYQGGRKRFYNQNPGYMNNPMPGDLKNSYAYADGQMPMMDYHQTNTMVQQQQHSQQQQQHPSMYMGGPATMQPVVMPMHQQPQQPVGEFPAAVIPPNSSSYKSGTRNRSICRISIQNCLYCYPNGSYGGLFFYIERIIRSISVGALQNVAMKIKKECFSPKMIQADPSPRIRFFDKKTGLISTYRNIPKLVPTILIPTQNSA